MSTLLAARDHAPSPAAPEPRTAAWRVAAAIARIEGVRLVRHPATLIGAALSTASAASYLWQDPPVLQRDVVILAVMALPIAAGVSLAANLATSRMRREEVQPLADVLPTTAATRTAGLLLALLWPAVAAAVWCAGFIAAAALAGGIGTAPLGDLLAPFGSVLLAGGVGVAVARWLPWPTAGVLALPIVAMASAVLFERAMAAGAVAQRLLPWSDWFPSTGMIEAWPRHPWVHLLLVVLASGALGGIALLRDHRTLPVVGVAVACVAGAGLAAVQLLNVWDEPRLVEALVRDVEDPDHRLRCATEDGIEVCLPEGYEGWAPSLRDQVVDAREVVPAAASSAPLRVVLQTPPPGRLLATLPDDVVDDLPPRARELSARPFESDTAPIPEPGVVGVSHRRAGGVAGDRQRLDLALGVIGQSTGVPQPARIAEIRGGATDHPWLEDGCGPQLSAAEVFTFALAAGSHPASREALARELASRPYGWTDLGDVVVFDGAFHLDGGATTVSATTGRITNYGPTGLWSRAAATLGLSLADTAPIEDLQSEWDRWVDPDTPAEDLLGAFGVTPLPAPTSRLDEADAEQSDPAETSAVACPKVSN